MRVEYALTVREYCEALMFGYLIERRYVTLDEDRANREYIRTFLSWR